MQGLEKINTQCRKLNFSYLKDIHGPTFKAGTLISKKYSKGPKCYQSLQLICASYSSELEIQSECQP